MKVSSFAPSEPRLRAGFLRRHIVDIAALLYLVPQLALLAPSLEDIDSINFALGLREFDVAEHQPHPPGYAAYIALGRLSHAVVGGVMPTLHRLDAQTLALAIWSAIGAAVALAAAYRVYRTWAPRRAGAAVLLLAFTPLFWISALRPMSDMPGLAAALVGQALLLQSITARKDAVWGALAAGLAMGLRIQAAWLTLPLLALVLFVHRRAGIVWLLTRPLAAAAGGVLVWLIPLLVASGGLEHYLRALGTQAGEDLTLVDILWSNPTPGRLALSLYETGVMPWGNVALALIVAALAGMGVIAAMTRERRALALMVLAFAPYVVFHLLFQETVHVRYALPTLVPVAWLVAQGTALLPRVTPVAHGAVVLLAGLVSVTGVRAYTAEAHPAFRAIADMEQRAKADPPAAIYSHYSVRRPLQAWAPEGLGIVEPPARNEWKDLLDYWRDGGSSSVWFVADSRRTDLALIDPQARRDATHYAWRAGKRMELGGVRPRDVTWYRFGLPGWFAGEGWSLTPELGGMTRLQQTGVDYRPIEALVRRRPDRTFALVGARHLGTAADGGAVFSLSLDGRPVDTWMLDPARGANVLHVLELPAGALAGEGPYARLTIDARAENPGSPTPPVAIRQFDLQSATGLLYGFDEGWHEEEYDNATGLRWRWTSERSVLRILPPQAVQLRVRGESPLKYFDAPPTVTITAGARVVAEFQPEDDFDWTVTVPGADVIRSNGLIAIATSPVYLPGVAEGTSDQRRLGLRVLEIGVDQVVPH